MANFKEINELNFWCQKVLPLVYDDSLSYYELLCKVVQKLNEVIANTDGIPKYIEELITEDKIIPIVSSVLDGVRGNIAVANEHTSTTATADRVKGELLWWKDNLYRVVRPINIGDAYIDYSSNPNIERVTVEILLNNIDESIAEKISPLEDALNEEIANRIESENLLQANIDTEEENRINGDSVLNENIEELKTKYSNLKTVKYYGAKGDGITDDTNAFNSAINANEIVVVPEGVYIVKNVELKNNTTIVGIGEVKDVIIKQADNNDGTVFKSLSHNNITIKNVTIDGNALNQSLISDIDNDQYSALWFLNCNSISIMNCCVKNGNSNCIYINGGVGHKITNVEACYAEHVSGICVTSLSKMDTVISGCYSHDNNKDGFTLTGQNISVNNCIAYNNGLMKYDPTKHEPSCGFYLDRQSAGCVIVGCISRHNTFAGIELSNASLVTACGNYIDDNNLIGIYVGGHYNIVNDNMLINNHSKYAEVESAAENENYGAIYVGDQSQTAANVFGNVINGNKIDFSTPVKHGIYIENSNNTLVGNSIGGTFDEQIRSIGGSTIIGDNVANNINGRGLSLHNNINKYVLDLFNDSSSDVATIRSNKPLEIEGINGNSILLKTGIDATAGAVLPTSQVVEREGAIYIGDTALFVYKGGAWHFISFGN